MVVKIDCWSVVKDINAGDFNSVNYPLYYKVWEDPHFWDDDSRVIKLCGDIIGHPDHEDYTKVITSKIIDVDNDTGTIVTNSGTQYILGKVDSVYVQWLETRNSSEKILNGELCHIPTEEEPFRKFKLSKSY